MVFSSYTFLFYFLPPLLALYYLIPRRTLGLRNLVLLAFSLFFYFAGGPRHLPLMLLSIAINYVGGLLCGRRRRWETSTHSPSWPRRSANAGERAWTVHICSWVTVSKNSSVPRKKQGSSMVL